MITANPKQYSVVICDSKQKEYRYIVNGATFADEALTLALKRHEREGYPEAITYTVEN